MDESQQINKQKINNFHEIALRLIYCDHSSNFQELLQRDNSVTIHRKNIHAIGSKQYYTYYSIRTFLFFKC